MGHTSPGYVLTAIIWYLLWVNPFFHIWLSVEDKMNPLHGIQPLLVLPTTRRSWNAPIQRCQQWLNATVPPLVTHILMQLTLCLLKDKTPVLLTWWVLSMLEKQPFINLQTLILQVTSMKKMMKNHNQMMMIPIHVTPLIWVSHKDTTPSFWVIYQKSLTHMINQMTTVVILPLDPKRHVSNI